MNYDESDWRPRVVTVDKATYANLEKEMFRKHFVTRELSIAMQCCFSCGGEAEVFADELGARDYLISGLCQNCQDDYYAPLEEDYADTGER